MKAHMILLTENSRTASVTVWGNLDNDGSRCFTVDARIYEDDGEHLDVTPLGLARYYDLRTALADADAVLAGYVTDTEQLKGEVLA